MIEFEILARGFFKPNQLTITYDPTLQMPNTPSMQVWMDRTWEERLAAARAQGFPLYDSRLFRLVSVERTGVTLQLVLGDTSYKDYTTTRTPDFFQGRERAELANPLAVCSVIETSDGYILYEKRRNKGVHEGRYHVIAGFFERDRDMDTAGMPDPFAAMRREMREETGIQAADIREQYCLGAVYDITSPHGELCFLTRLHIPLTEVHQREPEDNEIEHLLSLSITEASLRDFILTNHGHIAATGEPNLLMYGGLKYGEAWFKGMMERLSKL
jgi:8-oxo-dGTP pyrophosphatase MutT (NUDIX family)